MSAKPALQAAEPTAEFLGKFKAMIQAKAKDGDISDADVMSIFKSARGWAGGKMKAKKRAEAITAMGESYEDKRQDIQAALDQQYPAPNGYGGGKYSIQQTYDDHVIVCDWNAMEYYSVPYMVNGETIQFGDLVEVEQEWVEASENGGWRIFNEMSRYAEPPEWIPLMPKPGEFAHPEYGKIEITASRNEHFIQNFKDAVYQSQLPINAEHKPDEQGASGWITDMRLNEDGSIDGKVQWTDLGQAAVKNDRFKYISPEWFDEWTSKSTGETHQDVLSGAALTVRPFFKEDSLRPLVANEKGLFALEDSRNLKPKGRISGIWNEGTTTRTMTAFEPIKTEVKTMAESDKKPDPAVAKGMSEDEIKQFGELKTLVDTQTAQLKTLGEQLAAKDTELKEATGQVKTMREDMRRTRLTAMASGWIGEPKEHVSMLEFIADNEEKGEESERFKSYVERQRAFAEQAKAGKLFAELGHDGDPKAGSSALARMNAEADKLVAADPKLTHAQAFNQVMEKQPQLYNEYRAEQQ